MYVSFNRYHGVFPEKNIQYLPERLTFLSFGPGKISDESVKLLPRTLKTLSIGLCGTLTSNSIPNFPSKLTSLELWINNIDGSCFADLPRGLLHLKLSNSVSRIEDIHIGNLPKNLETLSFERTRGLTDEFTRFLPRTLKVLDISISNLPEEVMFSDTVIRHLPETLTSLNMDRDNNLTDACIPYLPRDLTRLAFMSSRLLTDNCVPLLPKSLKRLILRHNRLLTDACIEHLPRGLQKLVLLSNRNFTDSSCKHLPRGLTDLKLPGTIEFSDACAIDLPRTLTTMSLSYGCRLGKKCLGDLPVTLTEFKLEEYRIPVDFFKTCAAGLR